MMEDMPSKILVILVCLIIMGAGTFIITTFVSTTEMTTVRTESFVVTDPSVDLTVSLTFIPSEKPTVEQYNGIQWLSVDPTHVEWSSSKQVTVEHEGMQG